MKVCACVCDGKLHNGSDLGRVHTQVCPMEAGHCQYLASNLPSDLPASHSVDGVVKILLESSSFPLPRVCHHLHTTHTHTPCSAGQIQNALKFRAIFIAFL